MTNGVRLAICLLSFYLKLTNITELHFTEETELGSNDTIKSGSGSGPVVESSRGARKRESSNLGGPQTYVLFNTLIRAATCN